MKKSRLLGTVCTTLFTLITVPTNAALVGRLPTTPGVTDFQAAYDTVLDITWLTNASISGSGTWQEQLDWAESLNTANYLGFDDWRLASVAAGLPTGIATNVIDCSTATELACRDNELGYMFYQNMDGSFDDDKSGNQTVDGVLLTDVQSFYWSGTDSTPAFAWLFSFSSGAQFDFSKTTPLYAWAVQSGDIVAVPIPAAGWLFGTGLLGLIGVARRKVS